MRAKGFTIKLVNTSMYLKDALYYLVYYKTTIIIDKGGIGGWVL